MTVDMYVLLRECFERALPFIKTRLEEGLEERAWDEFSMAMEEMGIRFPEGRAE